MELSYYEQLCGNRRVSIRLSNLLYLDELLEQGELKTARQLVKTACAIDKRRELRSLREAVWRSLQKARSEGSCKETEMWRQRLRDVEELQKSFSV